jgi:nucleoside-triphosphatase THEP1
MKFKNITNLRINRGGVQKMVNEEKIGIIHEIGDMGLGYQELTEQEKKQLKEDSRGASQSQQEQK